MAMPGLLNFFLLCLLQRSGDLYERSAQPWAGVLMECPQATNVLVLQLRNFAHACSPNNLAVSRSYISSPFSLSVASQKFCPGLK